MAKQISMRAGIAAVLLLAVGSLAQFPDDSSPLKSEESFRAEAARIEKLPVPEPELIADEVREAQAAAKNYHGAQERKIRVSDADFAAAETDARAASLKLVGSVAPCKEDDVADAALALRNARQRATDPFAMFWSQQQHPDQFTPAEQRASTTVDNVVGADVSVAAQICGQLKTETSRKRFVAAVPDLFSGMRKANDLLRSEYVAQKPRALALEEAWQKREAQLTAALRSKRVGADKLLNELPWYIGIFCLFGLALIAMVRLFEVNVQMEWVASGQVIQFATVMVLLIVIAALAIAKILSENTLGTLLGGVAGYVLSQGVGRAVARAAERAADSRPGTQTPKSASDRVLRILRANVPTAIRGSSKLTLDNNAVSRVTSALNRMISELGGEPLDEETVSSATTTDELIRHVESAIQ